MALTEKGKNALIQANKYFTTESFSAKELSDICGEKIAAATLNGVVNNGYMNKISGSPVRFNLVENIKELMDVLLSEES